jgi:hypothetical protein
MNLDAVAIWLATRSEAALKASRESGLAEDLFQAQGKLAWGFIDTYRQEYGVIPSPSIISENSGLHVSPLTEEVPLDYVLDQMHDRAIWRSLRYGADQFMERMEEADAEGATQEIYKLTDHLRLRKGRAAKCNPLSEIVHLVTEQYERTKRGEIGVPFPWPTMTNMTLGMWPGTLTFFVARPGVGKTWTAINICWSAWHEHGKKILVVSPEMGKMELAERIVSRHGELSYGDVVSATLGSMGGEKRLYATVKELQGTEGFFVLDDEDKMEPRFIEEAIDAVDPDLVAIDSLYMLRVEQGKVKSGPGSKGGRYDRILAAIDWLRSLSRKTQKPFLAISQLSRDAKMKKGEQERLKRGIGTGGLEDAVAMSDTLFMDAHNLFAMFQDDDMKLDKQMMYVPLKLRRQANQSSVVTRWDMTAMAFDEIGTKVDTGDDFSDDGYDKVSF